MTPEQDTIYRASMQQGMRPEAARRLAELCGPTPLKRSTDWKPGQGSQQIRGGFLQPTRAAVMQPQASARDLETVCAACGLPRGFGKQFADAGMDLAAVRKTLRELEGRKPSKAEVTALSMTLLGRQLRRGTAHA